jgi:hypothetical protein
MPVPARFFFTYIHISCLIFLLPYIHRWTPVYIYLPHVNKKASMFLLLCDKELSLL